MLLTLNIVTTELQIALNNILPGEDEWDFPGTLATFLAIPTVWAVAKAVGKIRRGKIPDPRTQERENFFEVSCLGILPVIISEVRCHS